MKHTETKMNRRDALKLAGIGSASLLMGTTQAEAGATGPKHKPSKKKPLRIVIIGGGMAGTTLAYRLRRAITWPDITVFEPLRTSAWYQPGLTRIGVGTCCEKELEYPRSEFIPDGVKWIESSVKSIDPVKKEVTDAKGDTTPYDFLIIAGGAMLNYGAIEGLEGEIASLQMLEDKEAWMDDPAIASIYYFHGAAQLREQFNTLVQKAVENREKKLTVLFTQDSIAVKSPAAAKSALFALVEKLEAANVREIVEIVFCSGDGKLSANAAYDKTYRNMLKKAGVTFSRLKLAGVDTQTRRATFSDGSSREYDLLHITPPMTAPVLFSQSGLTNAEGWIEVDSKTLQHKRYKEIFAAGDAAGISILKTGAAVVEQVKTIVEAIRTIDEGEAPDANYSGYGCDTVLFPQKQTALMEAWDSKQQPLSLLSFLEPLKAHKLYWYLDTRLIRPYVMWGVMRGWA